MTAAPIAHDLDGVVRTHRTAVALVLAVGGGCVNNLGKLGRLMEIIFGPML